MKFMIEPPKQTFPWNLDWNLLRTFMVVVEQQGISKAAEFLGRKQPTVSAALKRLEEHTGQRLIKRKPNEFVVTRAGQVLFDECARIFGTVSQLPALLEVADAELRGHLTIATTSHVVASHFDDFLHAFANTHPNVTFSFTVTESGDVKTMVSQNRASLGICLLSEIPANLNAMILYREYFGLFCGSRHRLFDKPVITTQDLVDEPFVAFQTETEDGPLEAMSRLRAHLGLGSRWRGVSSSLNEIRRMIMANIGIGALPLHVANHYVALGQLRQLPPYHALPRVNIYLIDNPARSRSNAEKAFLEACTEAFTTISLMERTYGGPAD